MLAPARLKWRKQNKGRNPGMATRGQFIAFGEYGLQAIDRGRVSARQLEAARIAMTRFIKRGGKVWMRVFPDKGLVRRDVDAVDLVYGDIALDPLYLWTEFAQDAT